MTMADIAIIDSDSRRIDLETFEENLGDFSVDRICLEHGHIDAPIAETYDLSPYRGLYLRVGKITVEILDRAENLKIISTCGSGYDHIDLEAATERGIMVTHTPEAPAPGAIEHTFGFIFTLLNELPEMFERTASGNWGEGQTVMRELHGRTIGIVGLGTIGFEIAKIARRAFNADVIAYDPYVDGRRESDIYPRVKKDKVESLGITLVDKMELFESASMVTMHVPHTSETDQMVGREELRALSGGYFLNLSRGGVVNEEALLHAVERDWLEGVALDVMGTEPPNESDPLVESPDVFITPHIAGGKECYPTRSAKINADRMTKTLRGERPGGLVNPDVLH